LPTYFFAVITRRGLGAKRGTIFRPFLLVGAVPVFYYPASGDEPIMWPSVASVQGRGVLFLFDRYCVGGVPQQFYEANLKKAVVIGR
jgi:hypothetical protein